MTAIVSATDVSTQVGLPFQYRIIALGFIRTQGYWVPDHYAASPLPAGLTLDPDLGVLSGVPTVLGDFQIRMVATASSVRDVESTAFLSLHVTSLPNPPWFSRQPNIGYAVRGGSATLEAEAQGNGPLRYQWFRSVIDGSNTETRIPIPGATAAVLNLNSISEADADGYRLQVSNAIGSTFSVMTPLILVEPPQVTIRAGKTLMHAGGLIGIDGNLGFSQGLLSFQWRHNGAVMPGQTGASLVLYPLAAEDEGTYDLTVTNIAGSAVSNAIQITVTDPVRVSMTRHTKSSSVIRFSAIPGILYTIQSTADAPDDDAAWVVEEEVAVTTASFSRLVVDRGTNRFYRIQAR